MAILVTGGAGYIGGVVVDRLLASGEAVVVFDNLSTGRREAVNEAAIFFLGDLKRGQDLERVFQAHQIEAVIHLASLTLIGEAARRPLLYLRENVVNAANLLAMCQGAGIPVVFASTANIFAPQETPLHEYARKAPGSAYGESKLYIEKMLYWLAYGPGVNSVSLRFFNAAGATERRGEARERETHLIPLALDVALGKCDQLVIYGDDYGTLDGTCVRDYIHVEDLAGAIEMSLNKLGEGNLAGASVFNLGSGRGYSVREVVEAARRVTGQPIPVTIGPRRPGDPARLVADYGLAEAMLDWRPTAGLEAIIESAWRWRQARGR